MTANPLSPPPNNTILSAFFAISDYPVVICLVLILRQTDLFCFPPNHRKGWPTRCFFFRQFQHSRIVIKIPGKLCWDVSENWFCFVLKGIKDAFVLCQTVLGMDWISYEFGPKMYCQQRWSIIIWSSNGNERQHFYEFLFGHPSFWHSGVGHSSFWHSWYRP